MHIVTGGAGFIGSAFVAKLNSKNITDILVVDDLNKSDHSAPSWKNLVKRSFLDYLHKDEFLKLLHEDRFSHRIQSVTHMGACSSTLETDAEYMLNNNYKYSRRLAEYCLKKDIRFVYASSAATYGDGAIGYDDDDTTSLNLKPLNIYGYSKQLFDAWVIKSNLQSKMVGLKFFNVFGPNEYHKGEMRSVANKAYHQIKESGKVKLFRSFSPEYRDGEQKRDFVYVQDCVEVMWRLLENRQVNGIFNLGTGKARSWNDLVKATFSALGREPKIEYIEMPEKLKGQYQNFTEAKMGKLAATTCAVEFHSLEAGVKDYVVNYLEKEDPFL